MPRHVYTAGLAATYSEEAIDFIRKFDVCDHDPAATWREYQQWRARMTALFVDGHVFAPVGELGCSSMTPLQIIVQQAKQAPPIFYGDKVARLYSEPSPEEARALAAGIRRVVNAALDRLDVEFDLARPEISFTALDLRRWRAAFADNAQGETAKASLLATHAKRFFRHWKLEAGQGVRELETVARALLQELEDDDGDFDNRDVWRKMFAPGFVARACSAPLAVLPEAVSIYLSAMDSTGQVERDLGRLSNILAKHSGPLDEDPAGVEIYP